MSDPTLARLGRDPATVAALQAVLEDAPALHRLGHGRPAVLEDTAPARALWRAMGFTPTGEVRPWHDGPMDTRLHLFDEPFAT